MKFKLTLRAWAGWLAVLCFLFSFSGHAAESKDLKFEAQLIWATNDEKSPDPKHAPVDKEVRKTLSELPLRWKNYFVVKTVPLTVPSGGSKDAALSEKCTIEVKDIDGKNLEVSLIGKGKPVLKRIQSLLKGKMLVLGGNAPDSTGWLVVLKRLE